MLDPNAIYERDCTEGMRDIAPGSVDLALRLVSRLPEREAR